MNRQPSGAPVSPRTIRPFQTLAILGALALALGAAWQPDRLWPNLLLLGFLAVGFGLGGLLMIAFHDLTGSRWDEPIRGPREALAATLPWTTPFLAVVVFVGLSLSAYPWLRPDSLDEPTYWFKRWWLEPGFFSARAVAYLVIWALFSVVMVRNSRREAQRGAPSPANVRVSGAFLVVFAITFWLASADFVMSLEPSWYSTMFGVYNFGGALLGAQALVTIMAIRARRARPSSETATRALYRDLGTLVLSYSVLWMYFWFSQFMLIWYTNMPEETSHYASRVHGLWLPLFYANIVINWAVPFIILLPRSVKENAGLLGKMAILVLAGRWLDLYLMILPTTTGGGNAPILGPCEVGSMALTAGAIGLFLTVLGPRLMKQPDSATTSSHAASLVGARHG